ncbi:hypothetical protein ANN_02490 [Periplaneta americana]|uniref:ascorbate ferrireductase (transmembrane) n=1 Tax=Periplaneta americana TaxID=6978 RepID=A0ABQ8TYY1_PERAM|nr:hypothetical protein ANN_02490 [Periplaneta americana]
MEEVLREEEEESLEQYRKRVSAALNPNDAGEDEDGKRYSTADKTNDTNGSLLLMAEAVMIMSKDNILASKLGHQGRVRMHWVLQASAATCIFVGFLIIVVNKNINNKNHFQSWHAIIGLVFLIFVGITSSGGVITLFAFRLKHYVKPAKMKLLHNLVGIVTFAIGVVTEILGIYTLWFPKRASLSAQVICTVFVVLGGIFALESAVKSAYVRFKNLRQGI